jgi:Flp pilus assembly protein TadG
MSRPALPVKAFAMPAFAVRLYRVTVRLLTSKDGVSIIEFALILPIMVTILVGCIEFGRALDNKRKVQFLARTVADLTSQGDSSDVMRAATMGDIISSSKLILRPFDATSAKIVVSALAVDLVNTSTNPRVCSSYSSSTASKRTVGLAGDLTIPVGFNTSGMRYVFAEVSMPYVPIFGAGVLRAFTGADNAFIFKSTTPWPVRVGKSYNGNLYNEVILPAGKQCP